MHRADLERFVTAIRKPYGAVLVTGPTGSGKSTTLYGALAVINDGQRSIITIEDPVESQIAGRQADAGGDESRRQLRSRACGRSSGPTRM